MDGSPAAFRISRAMLQTSGTLLASKRNSEVFAFGEKHVLKLFREHVSTDAVLREHRTWSLVSGAGLPAPGVEPGVVRVDGGREGILIERARGRPLSELFHGQPRKLVALTRIIADAHGRIHAHPPLDGLPSHAERMAEDIAGAGKLSLRVRKRLLRLLQEMPAGEERVCHADLHPSNVMVTDGSAVVIDWGGAVNGDPLCDVARTWVLLRYPVVNKSRYSGLLADAYCMARARIYLSQYTGAIDRERFRRWTLINSALRLRDELTPQVARMLVRKVGKGLTQL